MREAQCKIHKQINTPGILLKYDWYKSVRNRTISAAASHVVTRSIYHNPGDCVGLNTLHHRDDGAINNEDNSETHREKKLERISITAPLSFMTKYQSIVAC